LIVVQFVANKRTVIHFFIACKNEIRKLNL